jgi:hypothetical protein
MKISLILTISLCFVFCTVFCIADAMAVQYLKMVVTQVAIGDGGGGPNAQFAEIYFFDQKGKEIPPNTIKIFAPECAGKGDSDGYNWDHTHKNYIFANGLDRNPDTFLVITNNAAGNDEITEKDPLPIVFEFHGAGIRQISKIELLPRQGCVGVSAPKIFYFEIGSDGKNWTRIGGVIEDDKPDGIEKRTFEDLNISLSAALEPMNKLTTTWASIKK